MQSSNCKTQMSGGCQKRTASNGTAVCNSCLGKYEAGLKSQKVNPQAINITNVVYTPPKK